MATKYQQGRDVEYAAIKELETQGYNARRVGASKGSYDVIAVCAHYVRFIQTKRFTTRPGSYAEDEASLRALRIPPNATTELWVKKAGQRGWNSRRLVQHDIRLTDFILNHQCFARTENERPREEPDRGVDQTNHTLDDFSC